MRKSINQIRKAESRKADILEIIEDVIRQSHAEKFIDQEASHLTRENKDKLIKILTKYEKFLSLEEARLDRECTE